MVSENNFYRNSIDDSPLIKPLDRDKEELFQMGIEEVSAIQAGEPTETIDKIQEKINQKGQEMDKVDEFVEDKLKKFSED